MVAMCIEVPYAVSGVELISVGNSTGTPASVLLKPRPVCRVRIFCHLQGGSRDDGRFRLRFWDLWHKLA